MQPIKLNNDVYEKLFVRYVNSSNDKYTIINICLKHDPFVNFQEKTGNNTLGYIHFSNSYVCSLAYQELLANKINVERPFNYISPNNNSYIYYSDSSPPYRLISFS